MNETHFLALVSAIHKAPKDSQSSGDTIDHLSIAIRHVMAENDIDYFIEKVCHSAMKISTFDVVRENAVRETRRPDGGSHG